MHTFEFIGKPFVSVVSTNGSGEEETIKYIDHTALLLGMIKVGSLIKLNNEAFNHKKQERLVKEIVKVLNDRKNLKPSIKNSLYFWSMKKIIRENLEYFEYENKVWEQRGWYKSSFKRVFLAN
jgi:multimeric flavodoxin WrbA